MHCKHCNNEYNVLVNIDIKEMVPTSEMEMETPYCPFCGEEDWRDTEHEVDL